MKYTNKQKIVNNLSRKKCFDISQTTAEEATKKVSANRVAEYSVGHYTIVYCILKAKLEEIPEPIQKISYLDCLALNYSDTRKNQINGLLDIATGIISGSVLGVYVSSLTLSSSTYIGAVFIILVLQWLKSIELSTTTGEFYRLIIQQLKNEL